MTTQQSLAYTVVKKTLQKRQSKGEKLDQGILFLEQRQGGSVTDSQCWQRFAFTAGGGVETEHKRSGSENYNPTSSLKVSVLGVGKLQMQKSCISKLKRIGVDIACDHRFVARSF